MQAAAGGKAEFFFFQDIAEGIPYAWACPKCKNNASFVHLRVNLPLSQEMVKRVVDWTFHHKYFLKKFPKPFLPRMLRQCVATNM